MSRLTDVKIAPHHSPLMPLPAIDWKRLKQQAPTPVSINYTGPTAPLPKADIVIITWTSAEWSALDHVFLNSDSTRTLYSTEWRKHWYSYSRDAPKSTFSQLWGYYQMVSIKNAGGGETTVLLFKSGSHLAHPPWIDGLSDMVKCIVADVQPKHLYSIGTAGGTSEDEALGDAVITNAAHIELKKPENIHVDYNHKTFTCKDWFPSQDLLAGAEKQLFFPMSNVVTHPELEYLLYKLHESVKGSSKYTLDDLVNKPLSPSELHAPKAIAAKDKPLLTTDFYYIAEGDSAAKYAFLEMDDAVIAHEAGKLGIDYAFIRNISDPLVASKTSGGDDIPNQVREEWSSLIYETFGLYTSVNSALTTWSTIAGAKG